jgi:hypothetical protein
MATDRPTPLLYLDVDDEITSAAARIRQAEAEEVVLVLPYGSRLATSRINFRLLAREASERGKGIQIICADASARALAAAAGLPVHASVAAFEAARAGADAAGAGPAGTGEEGTGGATRDPDGEDGPATVVTATGAAVPAAGIAGPGAVPIPVGGADIDDDAPTRVITLPRAKPERLPIVGPPRPPVRTGVAVGLGLAAIVAVIAGGLLALELLPAATITLAPRAETVGPLDLTVEARTDATAPDPATLVVPAERVTFQLTADQAVTRTGVKVTQTKATGDVTFSNFDTGRGVLVPAGTVVRTEDDVEFVTLTELTLPRAQIDFFPPFPTHPSTGSVGVEAVEPGEGGNVGNNTIVEVDRGGRNLFVTNPDPTTGGTRVEEPVVSEEDVAAAVAALETGIEADLERQIVERTGVPAEVELFGATRDLGEIQYATDPATLVGTTEEGVVLSASAEGTVLGVDAAPIRGIAESRLQARVEAGWTLAGESLDVEIGTPVVFGDVAAYPVTVSATQVRDVDPAALVGQVRGLLVGDARGVLDDYGDVEISVWPDWVTKIPTNADRIELTLADPQPAPTASPGP